MPTISEDIDNDTLLECGAVRIENVIYAQYTNP